MMNIFNRPRPNNSTHLPVGHKHHRSINFPGDHKVQIQSYFIAVVLLAVAVALLFELPISSGWHPGIVIAVTIIAALIYMALHEATHGIALHILSGKPSSYSLRLPFLSTGNQSFFTQLSLVTAALAPVVLLGGLLLAALLLMPADFRMTLYILLSLNFAGSAGDYVESAIALKQPKNALLRDNGEDLEVYLPV
ncbi:hypothetical protein COCCU_12630 [Corynebacterium occultum]|uniref:Zincin peptidase n=1 Tax=Corynebacterium occultum TaxID=2675219 RepID=A0A6B8WC29_9CORY|nr:DUF3267 domain-containing protein [Corynebacterium occultum]QGU08426.1 hypothetical protein COCCU_12630 [Corynebacterium occultum]